MRMSYIIKLSFVSSTRRYAFSIIPPLFNYIYICNTYDFVKQNFEMMTIDFCSRICLQILLCGYKDVNVCDHKVDLKHGWLQHKQESKLCDVICLNIVKFFHWSAFTLSSFEWSECWLLVSTFVDGRERLFLLKM